MKTPAACQVKGLELAVYSDVVTGPYAVRSTAVIAHRDELEVMAYHGLIRALSKGLISWVVASRVVAPVLTPALSVKASATWGIPAIWLKVSLIWRPSPHSS